ncbi:hypothetical protein HDK77DRAFT_458259 [Phyllosticta capitalensis]|uniref:Uncharacterized protein n=1 Tax=Phyllosticta capitalensis TaxID=121624 RepID=A0ABR1Z2V8_9PEZI
MTRPKVPPEQRQRTAQACEVCKRRKQKGSRPFAYQPLSFHFQSFSRASFPFL